MERGKPEVSIVVPCLNEEQGVGFCIDKIQRVIEENRINAEVIVVDNGSIDGSREIILESGVDLVVEPRKGYGSAYLAGFKSARGESVIMGDSDGSYNFEEIPRFLRELKENDFVIGNRFNKNMRKGAMPFLHKYVGNPILRVLLWMRGFKQKEVCTGFVGIRKKELEKMDLKETGMEFSSEILVKVAEKGLKVKEIDIVYGNRFGKSKLRTFRDGFGHFKYLIGC